MRVIFMGTPQFAVPTLDALVEAGHEVVLVVAQPDKPAGRGKKLKAPPVAARATALGLPLAQPRADSVFKLGNCAQQPIQPLPRRNGETGRCGQTSAAQRVQTQRLRPEARGLGLFM